MKTRRVNPVVGLAIVAVAGSAAFGGRQLHGPGTQRMASPPLPIPAPVPIPRRFGGGPALAYAEIAETKHESVLLAQVIEVQPLLIRAAAREREAMRERAIRPLSENDVPVVLGGRFAVLETLYGPRGRTPLTIHVENPPAKPHGIAFSLEQVVTRRMRVGEIWLLGWDPATGRVDLYGQSGKARLSGLDDPDIAQFRLHQARMDEPDSGAAAREMSSVALDNRQPAEVRLRALGDLEMRAEQERDSGRSEEIKTILSHDAVTILRPPGTSGDLQWAALTFVRVPANPDIARGSDEAFALRYLIRVIRDSNDPRLLQAAVERAYAASVQVGAVDGKTAYYVFPELLDALEQRASRDQAANPGGMSYAGWALSNLDLQARRDLTALKRLPNAVVVERAIPAE